MPGKNKEYVMSRKKGNLELIIIGIVIVLSVVYIMFRQSDKVHYKVPELENIKIDEISKISLTKGERTVILENRKGGWVVGEEAYPADDPLVKKILSGVANMKLTTLVSKAGNYFKYELDENRKINVKVFKKEDIIREFDTGKVASTYDHTNIRLKDDKNVYHARGSLKSEFDKKIDDLRDKKVFSFDKESISEITFTMNGKDYLLNKVIKPVKKEETGGNANGSDQKVETEWNYENTKIEISKLSSPLSILSDLKCDEYVYSENDLKGSELFFSLKLSGTADDDIKVYRTGDKEDEKYIGETSQSKYKFFIKKYKIENFLNPLKEIFGIKDK